MEPPRNPWKHRFARPTPQQLRGQLSESAVEVFDTARGRLRQTAGLVETVSWYGFSWFWCLEYRATGQDEPLAVLIPSPENVQIASVLESDFVTTLPLNRMRRAVIDGVDMAREPYHTRWGVWSLQPGRFLDELWDLLKRKLKYCKAG